MSTQRYTGRAQALADIYDLQLSGAVAVNDVYWVKINTKKVSFTATATTIANVVAGLLAALTSTDDPPPAEFQETTWTSPASDTLRSTTEEGESITITAGADVGAATWGGSSIQAGTGPTFWSNVDNWTSAVPIDGDDVVIDNFSGDITDGLGQSSVQLNSLYIGASFTGKIGRARQNSNGYTEYRDLELAIGAATVKIGAGAGSGSSRIKINFGTDVVNCEVQSSTEGEEDGIPAIQLRGTNAGNTFDFSGGSSALAYYADHSAVADVIRVASDAEVFCGEQVTIGDVYSSGQIVINSSTGFLQVFDGTATVRGTGAHTEIDVRGGVLVYESSGTAADVSVGPGVIDAEGDASAREFTLVTLRAGGSINDPNRTITYGDVVLDDSVVGLSAE